MATIGKRHIMAQMTLHGGPPASMEQKIKPAETYVIGELTVMVAGQLVEVATDTPVAVYGVSQHNAATELATGGTGRGPCWLADPETLFSANVVTTALANYVFLQSDIGRVMGILRDTSLSMVFLNAAIAGGASAIVWVHDLVGATPGFTQDGGVGDTNVRALFSFLAKYYQAGATS